MKKNPCPQWGQAIIELMIFLPLTVIFALSLVEVGMIFNTSQRVTNLSREAANTALRLCGEEDLANLENCLRDTALPILINSTAPETFRDFPTRGQIMISAYSWDQDTGALTGRGCVSGGKSSNCDSRFNESLIATLDKSLRLVFVGECLFDYQSLMNLNFFTIPWAIYDYTVF
jgi:hypothetical protein